MQPTQICSYGPRSVAEAAAAADAKIRGNNGRSFNRSFTNGAGLATGCLGEMLFAKIMRASGIELAHADTAHYDFVLERKDGRAVTFEVKTKQTSSEPVGTYANSVCAHNSNQQADWYVFLRSRRDLLGGGCLYFCGAMRCCDFRARARHIKKGESEGNNGFIASADHFSVDIRDCTGWSDFLTSLMHTTNV